MEIITSLVTAALLYRIKLVDDRERNNFQRYKNFVQRGLLHPQNEKETKEYDAKEIDEWLDKDVPCHMIFLYRKAKSPAILDYYQDYKDTETTKREIYWLIVLNIILLAGYDFFPFYQWLKVVIVSIVSTGSIFLCLRNPKVSLINNYLINTDNSEKAREHSAKVQVIIESDFNKYKKKYVITEPKLEGNSSMS